jgi:hypothetical protein
MCACACAQVTAYINGHIHALMNVEVAGVQHFTSGGGSKLDEGMPTPTTDSVPGLTFWAISRGFLAASFGALRSRCNEVSTNFTSSCMSTGPNAARFQIVDTGPSVLREVVVVLPGL